MMSLAVSEIIYSHLRIFEQLIKISHQIMFVSSPKTALGVKLEQKFPFHETMTNSLQNERQIMSSWQGVIRRSH